VQSATFHCSFSRLPPSLGEVAAGGLLDGAVKPMEHQPLGVWAWATDCLRRYYNASQVTAKQRAPLRKVLPEPGQPVKERAEGRGRGTHRLSLRKLCLPQATSCVLEQGQQVGEV
jgi:hypothetical protein